MLRHPQIAKQNGTLRVYFNGVLEMVLGHFILFLSKIDGTQTVPGVVMSRIQTQSRSIALGRFLKIFICKMFVPSEGISVRVFRIQLYCSRKIARRNRVLFVRRNNFQEHTTCAGVVDQSFVPLSPNESSTSRFKCHSTVE